MPTLAVSPLGAAKRLASLRLRVVALLVLIFGFALAAASYVLLEDRRLNLAAAKQRIQGDVQRIAEEQNDVVERIEQLLTLMQVVQRFEDFQGSHCPKMLGELARHDRHIANILIAGPDGDVICNASSSAPAHSIGDRRYFRKALAAPGIVIDEAVVSRSTGKWSLPFAKAIRDAEGYTRGVMVVALDLEWLGQELAKASYPAHARINLVSSEGWVLARYPDPERLVGTNKADTPFFRSLQAMQGKGVAETVGLDGEERIIAFAHFAQGAEGPLYLGLALSKELLMAPVNQRFSAALAYAAAIAVVAFAAIWLGGERLLLRPVSAITRAARRLGAGHYDARTGLAYKNDEIGELARTFDDMAVSLASKSELLRVNRALRVLSGCNNVLIHAESEENLLVDVCRTIVDAGGYRMAWVGMAEQDEAKSVRPVARYGAEAGYLDQVHISWSDTERGSGPTGTAIRTGTPQVNANFAADPRALPWREDALRRGYASSVALPLRDQRGTFGALSIYAAEPDAFSAEEMKLLVELADDLSFGVRALRAGRERDAALRAKEQYLKFFRLSRDLMVIADPFGCFKEVNPAFQQLTGYTEAELLAKPFLDFVAAEDRQRTADEMKLQVAQRPSMNFENSYVCKDGGRRLLSWVAYFDKTEGITYATARDITESRRNELALRRVNRALTALSNGNMALIHATDEASLLDEMCKVIAALEGYRVAWVGYVEDHGAQRLKPMAQSGYEEDVLDHPIELSASDERGPLSAAVETGKAQVVQDVLTDPRYTRWRGNAVKLGYGSVLIAPLKDDGQVFGTLSIYADERNAFDDDEIRLLDELANDLAFGVKTLRGEAARRKAESRLERSMEDSLQAIAYTLEMRDPYTAGHQRRVAALAVAIAREMGLPAEEVHGIHLAATVHDLGKIRVPAEILASPSKLTDLEFQMIKMHSQAGYDILKGIDFPWPLAEIILQHHERLDGSGYPRGLKGNETLIGARIVAIADTVEAMASHRPYRPAIGIDQALKEIDRNRDRLYDAAAADACVALFREKRFAFPA